MRRPIRRGALAAARFATVVVLLTASAAHAAAPARAARPDIPPVGFSPGPELPLEFEPRWNFSYGYFPPSDQVVVFGGAPPDLQFPWRNDTWLFTPGAGWTQGPAAPAALTPRGGGAMAYLPGIQRLVLFGGEARSEDGDERWPPYTNETWLWDGTSWSPGPAAPPELDARTGAQMVYDDAIQRIVLFGGSGFDGYNDTWLFDGTQWTPGPAAPAEMGPRVFFGMAYDPVAGVVVVGGGNGGADVWLFDGTSWTPGPAFPTTMVNNRRELTRMAYDPKLGAVVLFGGVGPGWIAEEIYFLKASDPLADWRLVPEAPSNPRLTPPPGRLNGAILWAPTLDSMMFLSGIQGVNEGREGLRDLWYFRDVAPVADSVTLSPDPPLQTEGIDAALGTVTGGYFSTKAVYRWTKNGVKIPGETGSHLDPQYEPGDVIRAAVQLEDGVGVLGAWVGSNAVIVAGARISVTDGQPGGPVTVGGVGFAPNENVDIRLGSATGTLVGTVVADAQGRFGDIQLTLPVPLPGGPTDAYGIGQTSGTVSDPDSFTVHPGGATLEPSDLAADQSTTFSAYGFLPGEQVSVAFPGQDPVTGPADEMGSFIVGLICPKLPAPGGDVIATAASGSTSAHFTIIPVVAASGVPKPGKLPVAVTGFAAGERVAIQLDGVDVLVLRVADDGSGQGVIRKATTFGSHVVSGTGFSSQLTASSTVELPATMRIRPTSGPPGTILSIESGPGWGPGGVVDFYVNGRFMWSYTADERGLVLEQFPIPLTAPPGVYHLALFSPTLGRFTRADFEVTP